MRADAETRTDADADTAPQRRAIRVRGAVQGVGFRPFVYRLAQALGLDGWVLNDAEGVLIEAQGPAERLARFEQRLRTEAPPLSRVQQLQSTPLPLRAGEPGFAVRASRAGNVTTAIPPDTATCADCLAELFDPADRRHRYAFINCTHCG
ncbi:MAG: acylphosphatase, partial [Aquabacterium sp.]|nr:acylphosphatase [Aquabacterium sp.]